MSHASGRPQPSEYAEYYERYVGLVPENDACAAMAEQTDKTVQFLKSISEAAGDYRYAPGKWSVKEVLGHVIDAERVFCQRALFFARQSPDPLPGFEQDDWAAAAWFGSQSMAKLIDEFELVRRGNWYFFDQLTPEAWLRRGIASEREFSVRALAYIMVGHERYHLDVLRTRYL